MNWNQRSPALSADIAKLKSCPPMPASGTMNVMGAAFCLSQRKETAAFFVPTAVSNALPYKKVTHRAAKYS
jgi:hypothetical protein